MTTYMVKEEGSSQPWIGAGAMDPKFLLCEGERVVRKYRATGADFPSMAGMLFVTTRRIVFQGEGAHLGGSSVLISEVPLNEVAGVSTFIGRGFNIVKAIIAAVLAIIFLFILAKVNLLIGLLLLLIPAWMIYNILTGGRRLGLLIYAKGIQPSPIQLSAESDFRGKLTGQQASAVSFLAAPGADAVKMATEIGALVLDLQSLGDMAVEKWDDKA